MHRTTISRIYQGNLQKRHISWRAMVFVMMASRESLCARALLLSMRTARRRCISDMYRTFRSSFQKRTMYPPFNDCHCRRNDSSLFILSRHLMSPSSSSSSDDAQTNQLEMDTTGLTVKEAIESSLSFLQEANAPEPEVSVTQLLASALDLPWSNGFVLLRNVMMMQSSSDNHELATRILTREEATLYQDFILRRANKEPLQYILGKWDFLDFTLYIRPPLLCPRPETEELVVLVAEDTKQLQQQQSNDLHILDIGCGTGAIGVSLAAMLPNSQVTAIDIEPIAVKTSNENAKLILDGSNVNRYKAVVSSASDFIIPNKTTPLFHVIVSNPPYIPKRDMPTLSDDVAKYESNEALCGGEDGMDVIRDILRRAHKWSRSGTIIWMEVDPTHPKLIQEWLEEEEGHLLGVKFDSTHTDLYGRDRFVKLTVI